MSRRQFLQSAGKLGLLTAGGMLLPAGFSPVFASTPDSSLGFNLLSGSRTLQLYRPESKERLSIEYLRNGAWVGDAYSHICWHLRDIHVNKTVAMDLDLIATLDWAQEYLKKYGYTQPLQILSGYRSQETNDNTEGAAKKSQHMLGRAIDIRVPGLSADYLASLFKWLEKGGVGTYANSNFVHLDTGSRRAWRG